MKQNCRKLCSIMLFIFILCVPFFHTTVDAATRFTLSNGKAAPDILYANHSYTLKVKKQKPYFYSNRPGLVSISKTSGRLLVKEPGTVTITAKKKGSSKVLCKKTFKVRRRSDYIVPSNQSMSFVTGQTKKLSIRKSPSNSTDVIRFKSNNTKIATVNAVTGNIKAVAPGTTSIVAYSKSSAAVSNSSSANRSVRVTVNVYSSMKSAKQTSINEVKVTFTHNPIKLKAGDFSLISIAGKKISVASVKVKGKTATLTVRKNLDDGNKYTLTYKSSSCKFTASDGVIKTFLIDTDKIPIYTETTIVAYAYDKNGIQLGEYEYGTTYSNIHFTISSHVNDNQKLIFNSITESAIARIYYKEADSTKVSADSGNIVISAYDPEIVSADYRCNITNSSSYRFTDDSESNLILPNESEGFYAHFNVITSANKEISDYSKFTVASGNTDIFTLEDNMLSNDKKYVALHPVQPGSTYLYLKDAMGVVTASFYVTVGSPSVLSTIAISKNSIFLNNTEDDAKEVISIAVKDQYGYSLDESILDTLTISCITSPTEYVTTAEVNENAAKYFKYSDSQLTFTGYQIAPGTYIYRVAIGQENTFIAVEVTGVEPYWQNSESE